MRVLMVTPSFDPIKGGVEELVKDLTIESNKIGITTDIMTFNMIRKWKPIWKENVQKFHNFKVIKIPAFNWFPITHSDRFTLRINLIPGRFCKYLKEYDIIHFHDGGDLTFPIFSHLIKKNKILHLHGFPDIYKTNISLQYILKHIADFYIAISKQMEKYLVKIGITEDKIIYLPNGVNTKLFRPIRKKEDNLLLFVGRITFGKGVHILLRSLHNLKEPVNLVIIGPADWSHKYYQEMLKLIERENRKGIHQITYLGTLARVDIAKWYQKASILILPTFREGLPIVALEALSCETPIITTPVGGVSEVVHNHENGILIPPNNAAKLAEAIEYLLNNKNIIRKFGKDGRKLVIEKFSNEVTVKRLLQFYEELV